MTVEIKFLGHSAFAISEEENSILIDPFISGNPGVVTTHKNLSSKDILLTHAHGDHLGDAIELSKRFNSTITAVFELANYCAKKGAKAQGVNIGGKVPFAWGYAYWLTAAHSSSTPEGIYGGCPASILVSIGGVSIYHAGDTGLHSDLKIIGEFYKPQISILPIGGYYTMGIDEAVEAAKWLGSEKIIPMHYNTFPPISVDIQDFKNKIESQTNAQCIVLKNGESLTL